MRLPAAQRSSVILMDVLGYSLQEIGEIMECSIPAVKAALHRGRARLREIAAEPDDAPPQRCRMPIASGSAAYVDRFNARDFDAIRAMLADDVRLELVSRTRMNGKAEVSRYFRNYSNVSDWHLVPGLVEGRPAMLVCDPDDRDAGAEIFHAAGLERRQGRHHQGFPPCALCDRRRGVFGLTRLISRRLPRAQASRSTPR